MAPAGKGYVIVFFYLCHVTDLIFFTNTVQRVLLLVRRSGSNYLVRSS